MRRHRSENRGFAILHRKAEHARFEREGLDPNPVKESHRDGSLMVRLFFVQDPDDYKIEVLERYGRYQ